MSIHQFTFTTLRVCCLKTWVDFHIGLWQQQMYRLIVNGKSFSSSRWCFQNGSTQSPRDRLWNVQRSYLFNQRIAFLSLIAIFVFQSPHLRPPENIIKTFLYHLSLFKDSSTNFLKCHRFSLTESLICLPTCSAALCSHHCTHDCTQTALELTLICLISIWLIRN